MHQTYAAYTAALDAGTLTEAMRLEVTFYRTEERRERWTVIGLTALWSLAAILPVHILTLVLP